ncbi:hypothetical protein [Cetobacterium sp.]|uniref:hypothetical protein n=1 Tax=Cetobacterium sp. TaxID=2071632 RepID=UPI003F2ACDBA
MIKKISNFIWTWFIQGYLFIWVWFSLGLSLKNKSISFLNIFDINLQDWKTNLIFFIGGGLLFSTLVELLKHSLITTFNWFVESSWKMRIYIIISSCLIIYGVLRKIL